MREANKHVQRDNSEVHNGEVSASPSISTLHAIPGFDRLSTRKLYPKGAVLFAEAQSARGVYLLCAGRAKVSITSAAGKTLIVRIARPGDLLGIHATLTGHAYEATAETLGACRVDFISCHDLMVLLERQKWSGVGLARAISEEFTQFVDHARVLLLSVSAAEKLARLLLRLGDEFGERTATGIRLQTLLTHEEIAQMIGVSRETVTRELGELRRNYVVKLEDNAIVVRNRKGLEAVAGSSS